VPSFDHDSNHDTSRLYERDCESVIRGGLKVDELEGQGRDRRRASDVRGRRGVRWLTEMHLECSWSL